MRRQALAVATSALVLLTACGGGESDSSQLRNAEDVAQEENAAITEVSLGDFGDLREDTRLAVTALTVGGDTSPWLEATVRFENSSDEEESIPDIGIICGNSSEQGGWQVGSTVGIGDQVPAESYREGVIHLLVPSDSRTTGPVPQCASPAAVHVSVNGMYSGDSPPEFKVAIPDDVLKRLNDALPTASSS